jgi:hypothetical protein
MPIHDVQGVLRVNLTHDPCKLTGSLGLTHIKGSITLGPEQGEPGADSPPLSANVCNLVLTERSSARCLCKG